jgi:polyhydroxybutyrate depolymerase
VTDEVTDEQPGTLTVGGVERTFLVLAPDTPPAAILLVLHGSNSDASGTRTLSGHTFDRLVAQGVLVAYPESHGGMWNDARTGTQAKARDLGIDDVEFLSALVTHLRTSYAVAADRVFGAGFSNGGQMLVRVVHEAPELIAGAALIGSNHPTPGNTLPEVVERDRHQEMPVLCLNGTKDPIVPFNGGIASLWGFKPRGPVMSSLDSARYFATRNGITAEPVSEQVTTGRLPATLTRWRQAGHAPVDFYAIRRGGHTIPNPDHRAPWILGRTARNLDTGTLVRDFFGLVEER